MSGIGAELLNVPLPQMVANLSMAIAEAQTKLDTNSTAVAKFMATTKIELPKLSGTGTEEFPIIALGFFPGFYQFQKATIKVAMAISMSRSTEFGIDVSAKGGFAMFSASVNASYKSKYNYSQEGSSSMEVVLAPAPPPALLEAYMQAMVKIQSAKVAAQIAATEAANDDDDAGE
tara:strand:- start:3674 stop:4198 length:525 start_codon:yes stop_codon:yes gene_type:complete